MAKKKARRHRKGAIPKPPTASRSRSRIAIVAGGLALALLVAVAILARHGIFGGGARQQQEVVNEPSASPTVSASSAGAAASAGPPTYAGGAACAECHPKAFGAWRGSDHDRAMAVADESTVLGDFAAAKLDHFGVTTTFSKRDGKFLVQTDGPDGKLHDYEIAYTFGVYPLQQYLIAFPGGRYQALSIAWDSRSRAEGGQRWFHLYPKEAVPAGDLLHWTGFVQNWNARCAECHSTNLRKGYVVEEDRYETTWSEIDVSCEACHGAGSNHVAWARRAEAERSADPRMGLVVDFRDREAGWSVNPATGIARRARPRESHAEVETCARCHSRRGVVSEDYVPGRPLIDTHRPALLEETLYFPDGQIEDEDYEYGSFLQSKMYRAGVTCTNCHDPHSLKLRTGGEPDAVCAQCHLPARFATPEHHHHAAGSPGASCVACHMPARTYMVVDERRDHSIRVPRPDLSAKIGTPNACNESCHADRSELWAAQAVAGWRGPGRPPAPHFAEAIDAGRRGLPHAEDALARLADDRAQPDIARATAVSLLWRSARPETLPTLDRALRDDDPMVRWAAVSGMEAVDPHVRVKPVAPLLRDPVRTVRIAAARVLAAVPPERMSATERSAFEAALDEYRRTQLLNADSPEGQLNLGALAIDRGDMADAERDYLAAIRMAPSLPQPYVNLADLYRMQRRDDEAERRLREGITHAPEAADLHHTLGLTLVREKRTSDAIDSLRRAADLAPDRARYAYVLAIALNGVGQRDQALSVLRDAHLRHSADRDILVALATISRDAGDRVAAIGYARELVALSPSDREAQGLLSTLQADGS